MATIKKKWKEVQGLRNLTVMLHNQHLGKQKELEEKNKFGVVTATELSNNKAELIQIKKEVPTLLKVIEHFEKQLEPLSVLKEDIEIDNALTKDGTPKSALLRNEAGGFEFTPAAEKAVRKAVRELMEVEVDINILELQKNQKLDFEFLSGFVTFKK